MKKITYKKHVSTENDAQTGNGISPNPNVV